MKVTHRVLSKSCACGGRIQFEMETEWKMWAFVHLYKGAVQVT